MSKDVLAYLNYIIITLALLALIFLILWLVGRKKNKAFKESGSAMPENYKLGMYDIVLLKDGMRVEITEVFDDGARFGARTLPDYGKTAKKLTVASEDIVKIEYYGSRQ